MNKVLDRLGKAMLWLMSHSIALLFGVIIASCLWLRFDERTYMHSFAIAMKRSVENGKTIHFADTDMTVTGLRDGSAIVRWKGDK